MPARRARTRSRSSCCTATRKAARTTPTWPRPCNATSAARCWCPTSAATATARAVRAARSRWRRMKPADFAAMSSQDMVAIRSFLIDENNGGGKSPRLNLNKLCIVGAGMGATVAVEFARDDWNLAPAGPWQMGSFTKALVLISPELNAPPPEAGHSPWRTRTSKSNSPSCCWSARTARRSSRTPRASSISWQRFHPLPEEAKRKEQADLVLRAPGHQSSGDQDVRRTRR